MDFKVKVKSLFKKRHAIMHSLAYSTTFFRGFQGDLTLFDIVLTEIEQRLPRIEALIDKFHVVQSQIEQTLGHLSCQTSHRINFKKSFLETLAVIRNILKHIQATNNYQARYICIKRHLYRISKKLQKLTTKADVEESIEESDQAIRIGADKELFLQAFEKPTRIYKYLSTKHMISPIFLYRTLSYMKYRFSRIHKSRCSFKVDSILENLIKKMALKSKESSSINIAFIGFNQKCLECNADAAEIETFLIKMKSNDCGGSEYSSSIETPLGTVIIPVNPDNNTSIPSSNISFPSELFEPSKNSLNQSYILMFKIRMCDAEPPSKKRRLNERNSESDLRAYEAELIMYDNGQFCLNNGEYDVAVQNVSTSNNAISNGGTLEDFMNNAVLKLKIHLVEQEITSNIHKAMYVLSKPIEAKPNTLKIFYNFLHNSIKQQTEASAHLSCPWCSLNCKELYILLKHLRLCHARFSFTYTPITDGARIDVAVNDLFDGSYDGSPYDLMHLPNDSVARDEPQKRVSVTHILVCYPKLPPSSLEEFTKPEYETDIETSFITGHNRLYHHSSTHIPMHPKEGDVDSEGENNSEWLKNQTQRMIDDFQDVNDGEKQIMIMWNLHVLKYGFVGDSQMHLACKMFVEENGEEVLLKNLYRNFVVHLCNLFDFELINAITFHSTIGSLQQIAQNSEKIRNSMTLSRKVVISTNKRISNCDLIVTNGNSEVSSKYGNHFS